MADQEQYAREDAPGISADDLTKLKSRAEAAESIARAEREGRERVEQENVKLTQERDQAHQRITEEVSRRVQADEVAINQALSAATSEKDNAAKELADALAANDAAAISKAIDKQSTARFEMIRAEDQNRNLQSWKQQQVKRLQEAEASRQRTTQQDQETQRQQPQRQQTEQQAGSKLDISQLPPGHQQFFRNHPELMEMDAAGNRERSIVIADHWDAVGRGIIEGTPSYYEFIEGAYQGRKNDTGRSQQQDQMQDLVTDDMEINLERPQDTGTRVVRRDPPVRPAGAREHELQSPQSRQQASSALPPSRSHTPANGNGGGQNGRITLSLGEQESARYSFPHLIKGGDATEAYKEYARNKAALVSEGRL